MTRKNSIYSQAQATAATKRAENEDGDLLYLPLALQEWGSLTTNFGLPVSNEAMPDSPGFLPVFNSREAAQREYPGHTICTIRKEEKRK